VENVEKHCYPGLIGTCIGTYINLNECVRRKNYGVVTVEKLTLLASSWFALKVIPAILTSWVYN
jgi:hypothetical protein